MKVKAMIKENNALREQMTPFNRSYMEDMILAMRASRVERVRAEELLLEAAQLLLVEQKKGKNAKQIFGENPEEYFSEIMNSSSKPPRPARSKLNYYSLIAVASLSSLFGVYGIFGLLMLWGSGSAGMFGQISLFTLILVGAGSVICIELLMKWMSSLSEDDTPRPKAFNLKSLGIYIGIAVIAIFVGSFLDNFSPAIPLSPWVSLILSIAGGLGLKFIFFRS